MNYGYVRVSSNDQRIDRQMHELVIFGILEDNIYIDHESGKNFNRLNYMKLKKKLKEHDLLVVKSIDRFGRDYDKIIEEWRQITKVIKADIVILDMPLLDTRAKNENLVGTFISDIVLQVLSFVAQNERENIKIRQREGIRLAKARGVHMGRPKYKLPANFDEVTQRYRQQEISLVEVLKILKMKQSTFYKYYKKND